ncbi:hypothetical protein F53441_5035 [Fusarium austroafricanum]|uniref:Alpha/beta hydrolase fold-3 domain-containing protein n=1 Tax=Fusarium austroafricanum TaxID=2364996 RepID=A0A8H4P8S2_9HYPO|nr:hypothetical protein F53441_5035 [Fusarium austroafricanum]
MSADNKIVLYDITSRPPVEKTVFSPNPWKSRLALNFKGVPYSTSWTTLPDITKVRSSLKVPACRTFADGKDFYTLPMIHDLATGSLVGDSFDIALYLQKTYPSSGGGDLFPPQTLDYDFSHSNDFLVPLSDSSESEFSQYTKFNRHIDALFTTHVQLGLGGMPFDPASEEETKAEFLRRAGLKQWDDFALVGEAREKMLQSFEEKLGGLAKLFDKDTSRPFLLGEKVSYADMIVALYYIFRSNRPHRDWTLHQALGRKLMLELMQFYTNTRLITPMPTEHSGLNTRFISIPPAHGSIYRGPLEDKEIQPGTVRAIWYHEAQEFSALSNMAKGEYLLLHFHGGGYVLGSPFPLDSGYMAGVFAKHITTKVLFAGYRLTCVPEGRFPAALQDAVTLYLHILAQGIPVENLVISGDSAGGHLVISLLRYIKEYLPNTPSPKAALLWSPWIDVTGATPATHVLRRHNYDTDYLPADFAEWATESFAPRDVIERSGPYVTLRGQPFRTTTRLWTHIGDAELLYDEVIEWVHDMREAGNEIDLRVEAGAPHDIVESGYLSGFRKKGERVVEVAEEWLGLK